MFKEIKVSIKHKDIANDRGMLAKEPNCAWILYMNNISSLKLESRRGVHITFDTAWERLSKLKDRSEKIT